MSIARSATSPDKPPPIRIFLCSCGHRESEQYSEELEKHLAPLMRQKLAVIQQSHKILAGLIHKDEIIKYVYSNDIVILFISSFLFSSDEYWEIMVRAMTLRDEEKVRVIPILASPADYKGTPLKYLQVLPRREKPLSQMSRRSIRDEAYVEIVQEIRKVIEEIRKVVLDLQEGMSKKEEATKEAADSQSDFNDPIFHKALGDIFFQRRQYDKAIAAYNKAISLDPDFDDAYRARAEVYRTLASLNYEILKRSFEQSDDSQEGFK
jgi:tetratricopeptide (TPR) repeat protein